MDPKDGDRSVTRVRVLGLVCVILLGSLQHYQRVISCLHMWLAENLVHTDHFQTEPMNSQIVVIRLSMSVGNKIQRNMSSFRKRSPTSGACST